VRAFRPRVLPEGERGRFLRAEPYTLRAGGSETRPACHDAGLPGAGCPGGGRSHIRWRCHEARDRTEPSLKTWREPR
jgi:hypothetical protein